jgi:hypothetical protein
MLVRRCLAAALLSLTLAGCPAKPPDGAVRLEVSFSSFKPQCLVIGAADFDRSESAPPLKLDREALKDRSSVVVAVARKASWSQQLTLRIQSYEKPCDAIADGDRAVETLVREPVEITPEQVTPVALALTAIDGDGDGFASPGGTISGTDCNDAEAGINTAAVETCAEGLDLDCDSLPGCSDPQCDGKTCDDGDPCSLGDTCALSTGRCTGTPRVCASPAGCAGTCNKLDGGCGFVVSAGVICDGGLCRSDGTCAAGEARCFDGVDNDGNGDTDCDDDACQRQACDDREGCTENDTCLPESGDDFECRGSPKVCNNPPAGPCYQDAGVCVGGACSYSAATGRPCTTPGNLCIANQTCLGNATCGNGAPVTCNAPPNPNCYADAGTCNAANGVCGYTVQSGRICDDGKQCTQGDACAADGSCAGTPFTCVNTECRTCPGDGGCIFTPRTGQACTGGACTEDGLCRTFSAFGYTPNNFAATGVIPATPLELVNCTLRFNTTGTGTGIFSGCDSAPRPGVRRVTDGSGADLLVISVTSLKVEANAKIELIGTRPVIFAVYGDAEIKGPIEASSLGAVLGAGASPNTCGAQAGQPGGSRALLSLAASTGGGGGGGRTAGGNVGLLGANAVSAGVMGPNLPTLRGGCSGGPGGDAPPSTAGLGGGAVQISAAGSIRCESNVSANGTGGGPGSNDASGGGGGSGGAVLLEANELDLRTGCRITANGGGGGGGAGNGGAGSSGGNGSPTSGTPAPGGANQGPGGMGGNGAAGALVPGNGSDSSGGAGGGGGGGASGRILLRNVGTGNCKYSPTVVSPTPDLMNCP